MNSKNIKIIQSEKDPMDIVKYVLYKFAFDGDLITNLKMQKILYYIYAWNLRLNKNACFQEKFQAWPIGPVLPSIYRGLKRFGSNAIDSSFTKIKNEKDLAELIKKLGNNLKNVIDQVCQQYGTKSAFELVVLTHNELSWKNAREGLKNTEKTTKELSDEDIFAQYVKK
jgi:uncharacterized phage-associated protein